MVLMRPLGGIVCVHPLCCMCDLNSESLLVSSAGVIWCRWWCGVEGKGECKNEVGNYYMHIEIRRNY